MSGIAEEPPKTLSPGESFNLSLSELPTVSCKFSKNSNERSCWGTGVGVGVGVGGGG